ISVLLTGRFMTSYFDLIEYSLAAPEVSDAAAEEFLEEIMGNALGFFGSFLLVALLNVIGSALVSLISVFHIDRFLHGVPSTFGEGWRQAMRRILPLVGMQIIQFLVIGTVTAVVLVAVVMVFMLASLVVGGVMAGSGNDTANVILMIGLIILF